MSSYRPRLSYAPSVDFSLAKTIIGYFIIASGTVGAVVVTLMTKGWVPSPSLVYLSDRNDSAHWCNSTAIYPGQTFFHNTTFTYKALHSFSYAGEPLVNCELNSGSTQLGVYGPPMGSPRLEWELSVTCRINDPLNASFSPVSVVLFDGPNKYGADDERRLRYATPLWKNAAVTLDRIYSDITCSGKVLTGYKAYEDREIIDFYPELSSGVCNAPLNNDTAFYAADIRSLLSTFKAAVFDDFVPGGQRISPLPNLLYPCSARARIRAPWRQIVLDCLTAAAAIFSPLFAAVVWILQRVPLDLEAQEQRVPDVAWKLQTGDAGLMRDEDAQTLFLLPRRA